MKINKRKAIALEYILLKMRNGSHIYKLPILIVGIFD